MNARFWQYINGSPVKITLREGGDVLHWECGGPCEEGYHREYHEWRLSSDGTAVESRFARDSRDCDGRVTSGGEYLCPLTQLAAGYQEEDQPEVRYPVWQELDHCQRDYSAEAAGY